MKKILLMGLMAVFISGCGLVAHTNRAVMPDGKSGFTISCGGAAGWSKCYEAAGDSCKSGYSIIKKDEEGYDLMNKKRSLLIACK
jgi:hypothetical protein